MGTVARTQQGEVSGREKDGAVLFAGIPYAAPPVGERRFLPPEPHEGWRGVREARRFGPAAPQLPGEGLTAVREVRWDEDCLTLNVCTPALDDARRPVLVWIHGGGFQTGQGGIPWYSGASFARRGDVVTVSLNYRLGALGFAHLAHLDASCRSSGLCGILDQIAALRWVRDNIAAFGGDPDKVTVAGESAGGMSVGVLLGSPEAVGLFRGAIPQSGAARHVLSEAKAREVGTRFADALRADGLAELRARSASEILEAQRAVAASYLEESKGDPTGLGGMPFRPVVDGAALPRHPLDAVRSGNAKHVRVLLGTNAEETTLWGFQNASDARVKRLFESHLPGRHEEALATYRAARPGASPGDLAVALTTDHMFRVPAVRLAEAHHEGGGRAWKYLFGWRSRAFDGKLGATHALEIPFAFHNLDKPGVDVFLGPGEPPWELAGRMHEAWTAFVRTGDPNCDANPPWPHYEPGTRRVMEFAGGARLLEDPGAAERALWDGVV